MSKPTIYFAHPITLYLTPIEHLAVKMLEKAGYNVINPSDEDFQNRFKAYKAEHPDNYMQFFVDECEKCDEVAFMCFPDYVEAENVPQVGDRVGAGVMLEVESFWKRSAPVWYVPILGETPMAPVNNWDGFCVLSVDETRTLLKIMDPDYSNWERRRK